MRAAAAVAIAAGLLTLVIAQRDPNGLPFDPHWAYQDLSPAERAGALYADNHCPSADPKADRSCSGRLLFADRACNHFVPDGTTPTFNGCTSDPVSIDERPHPSLLFSSGILAFACYYLTDGPEELVPASVHGHIDWQPVTFDGTLRFSDANVVGRDAGPRAPDFLKVLPIGDGDLDFMLEPSDGYSGLLAGNRTASHIGMLGNDGLTVEINSSEVQPELAALPWWSSLMERLRQYARRTAQLAPMPAIVVGMFGIDTKHLSHTELHPVFGLAVESARTENTEVWDVFARSWGYEGSCSNALHVLEGANGPLGRLTFTLPVPAGYTIDASASSANDATAWTSSRTGANMTVTARLAPPSQREIVWYHLVLHGP